MRTVIALLLLCSTALAADYPIVYVRTPRQGDGSQSEDRLVRLPEVFNAHAVNPGTDLVVINPDGSQSVLVDAGDGQCLDPYPSFDAQWVYYSYAPDSKSADIWKVNVASGEKVRLTNQEKSPHTGWNKGWPSIFNLGPCPIPGGKVAFTTSRQRLRPNGTGPEVRVPYHQQLALMDDDGKNQEITGHLNLGSALHPTILTDGRIMWSSEETHGHKDPRSWGVWSSTPDGRNWHPVFSAYTGGTAVHFQTQRGNGDVVVENYYNEFNGSLGEIYQFPYPPKFGDMYGGNNPPLAKGQDSQGHAGGFPFQPEEAWNIGIGHSNDVASSEGKIGMPSGAPNNELLVVYSSGPVSSKTLPTNKPYWDHGIYIVTGDTVTPSTLVEVVNSPDYLETQPKALVPYADIYGIAEPPVLTNKATHAMLPEGTPFGIIGTSGVYLRESHYANKTEYPFGIRLQGGDAENNTSQFDDSRIDAIRILAQEPTANLNVKIDFVAQGNERLRVLGDITLRKTDDNGNVFRDSLGDPDTSFQARIPADTSFTFQLLDDRGAVLTTSQTWHQVRPGEVKTDCAGCHFHSAPGQPFSKTFAATPEYKIPDLTTNEPWTVEWYRDIAPIVDAKCKMCHSGADAPEGFTFAVTSQNNNELRNFTERSRADPYRALKSQMYNKARDGAMPPPDSGIEPLTEEEVLKIGQWIDLGMQVNKQEPVFSPPNTMSSFRNGVFEDDSLPTLHVSEAGTLKVGAFDYFSGLAGPPVATINGEAVDLTGPVDSVWTGPAMAEGDTAVVTATDKAGHETVVKRHVRTTEPVDPEDPDPEDPDGEMAELKARIADLESVIDAVREAVKQE